MFAGTTTGPINLKVIGSSLSEDTAVNFKRLPNIWFLGNFLWQKGVVTLSWSHKYDVIIHAGNAYYVSTWLACMVGRLVGVKALMKTHGMLRAETGTKGAIRCLFYRLAWGLLLYERRAKELLVKKEFNSERLYVTFNSLDYATQKKVRSGLSSEGSRSLRASIFSEPDLPLLIFIGRLTHRKRLDLLLAAMAHLKASGCKVNFALIGNGPEMKNLVTETRRLGLDEKVKFLGEIFDESAIGPWLYAADICVSPGEVGLTAIHAFAYGTPVITHNDFDHQGPEAESIIENVTGVFFQRDSYESLATAIHGWVTTKTDRESVRASCIGIIEELYNPGFQVKVFSQAVFDAIG